MLEKNPADRPTLLQIQEHRWCRAKCRSGSREIIITSISGDETVYSNFEEYIGRSLSPELEPTKSDITLKPIRKKTQTKSLVSDNIIAGRNAGLNVDHLNLFNRRTTGRRETLGSSLKSTSLDRTTAEARRGRLSPTLIIGKLDRSASVSPFKGSNSTLTLNENDSNVDLLLWCGVPGVSSRLEPRSKAEKHLGHLASCTRSVSGIDLTSEKLMSFSPKEPNRTRSFGMLLNALPPNLLRDCDLHKSDKLDDHNKLRSESYEKAHAKTTFLVPL